MTAGADHPAGPAGPRRRPCPPSPPSQQGLSGTPPPARPPLTRAELRAREQERLQRLRSLDEQIGDALRASAASGELQRAPSWGRPMAADDGFDATPPELRMPFKILKDAGVVPPEVELMQRIAALQAEHDAASDPAARRDLLQRLAELRQLLAMRIERLRISGSL